jgi:methylisocitrate lyase
MTPGEKFRQALREEKPLQIVGTVVAYHALLAKRTGYKAIYLSGGGVAASSARASDLGIFPTSTTGAHRRAPHHRSSATVPLLVDADTGFGSSASTSHAARARWKRAGAALMQIEDQVGAKRCGTAPTRSWWPPKRLCDRRQGRGGLGGRTSPS